MVRIRHSAAVIVVCIMFSIIISGLPAQKVQAEEKKEYPALEEMLGTWQYKDDLPEDPGYFTSTVNLMQDDQADLTVNIYPEGKEPDLSDPQKGEYVYSGSSVIMMLEGEEDALLFRVRQENGEIVLEQAGYDDTVYHKLTGENAEAGTGNKPAVPENDSFSDWTGDFRDVHWGDSKEEVQKKETSVLAKDAGDLGLLYNASLDGIPMTLMYTFEEGYGLNMGVLSGSSGFEEAEDWIEYYRNETASLKEIYGEPASEETVKKEDDDVIEALGEARALSYGFLSLNADWKLDNGLEILTGISCKDKKYTYTLAFMYRPSDEEKEEVEKRQDLVTEDRPKISDTAYDDFGSVVFNAPDKIIVDGYSSGDYITCTYGYEQMADAEQAFGDYISYLDKLFTEGNDFEDPPSIGRFYLNAGTKEPAVLIYYQTEPFNPYEDSGGEESWYLVGLQIYNDPAGKDSLAASKTEIPEESGTGGTETPDTGSGPEERETGAMSGTASTEGEKQAVKMAEDYLAVSAFSYLGLISQLEFSGFSHSEAVFAADTCGADWKEQAYKSALAYLEVSAFSYQGIIDQLEYSQFTHEEAVYGADNCGADWKEQAAKAAKQYLEVISFSKEELIDQLKYSGFTEAEAAYGVSRNGF